jgi:hypothetical protein
VGKKSINFIAQDENYYSARFGALTNIFKFQFTINKMEYKNKLTEIERE